MRNNNILFEILNIEVAKKFFKFRFQLQVSMVKTNFLLKYSYWKKMKYNSITSRKVWISFTSLYLYVKHIMLTWQHVWYTHERCPRCIITKISSFNKLSSLLLWLNYHHCHHILPSQLPASPPLKLFLFLSRSVIILLLHATFFYRICCHLIHTFPFRTFCDHLLPLFFSSHHLFPLYHQPLPQHHLIFLQIDHCHYFYFSIAFQTIWHNFQIFHLNLFVGKHYIIHRFLFYISYVKSIQT